MKIKDGVIQIGMDNPIIPLGTEVKPWGKIGAVHFFGSGRIQERYYALVDKHGGVALIPADDVEAALGR